MAFFTAIAAWVVTAIGATGVWATVTAFAVRALLTIGISKLLSRNSDSGAQATGGGRVPVNPSTENKIPVVYGTAFMAGTVVDAKISTDQQWMWYVFAMSEVTGPNNSLGTITYDDIFWNGNKVSFDLTETTRVVKWTTNSEPPQDDTKVDGSGWIYLYPNGSSSGQNTTQTAIQVLSDSMIEPDMRWTSTCTMDRTAFIIIKVKYNQNAGITSCPTITAKMTNTLSKPGAVLLDYLTNTRYGCAIPYASVDTAALEALDTYSDELITYYNYPYTGATSSQPRYRINGPLMTGNECMTNITTLTDACDSWLQFNEIESKWSVVINQSYLDYTTITSLYHVTDDNLIGGIEIQPTDLNSTYNAVEMQYPDTNIKDGTSYQYINLWDLNPMILSPNEPFNQQTISLPVVNNAVQAIYIGSRRVYQGREDMTVNLSLDYSGIQIEAGDVIRITSAVYGWDGDAFPDGKLFRVIQVMETKTGDGNLGVQIVASEYNETVYADDVIQDYIPSENSGLQDPTILGTPFAPVVSDAITSTAIPSFTLSAIVPYVGNFTSLEYWYAIAPTGSPPSNTTTFKLWETQYFNDGPVYVSGSSQSTIISGLPATVSGYSYFFRVRACGQSTKSAYSDNSDGFTWSPNPTSTIVGQNFQTSFQPSPITVGQFGNGAPDLANVSIKLYGLVGPGQVDFNATQSNAALGASEWRIDNANIVSSGITIGTPTDGGTFAVWPAPSALSANVATMAVPVIFKDSTGNLHSAPSSVININKTVAGQDGTRGIVTLAYVPTGATNPTTANDSVLTGFFSTTTGYATPIDKDGACFYASNNVSSTRQYNGLTSPKWQFVTLQVPGSVLTGNSIDNSQLIANTITAGRIAAGTITGGKIAGSTITGTLIAAGTLTGNLIAANTITGNLIAGNTITGNHITANAVTANTIAAGAVTTAKMTANTILGNVITTNTLHGNVIIANTVNGNVMTANTLHGNAIIADTVNGNVMTANTLYGNAIIANTVNGNVITANTVNGNVMIANTLYGNAIIANTINGNAITANTITGNMITANSIDSTRIQAFTLTSGQIQAGGITASSIAANTITFENLVIGAVTQSKSTISTPQILPQPFYNWPGDTTWPHNTRCIVPPGGVTIIPTTDPRSSANTEYTEGSRIEVGFSAKFYTSTNSASNLIEIWKSGASSVFDRGFNTVRHSYNLSGNAGFTTQTIHALGYGAEDYRSTDGGTTWSVYSGATTSATLAGSLNYYSSNIANIQSHAYGPLQVGDNFAGTGYVNWGQRVSNNAIYFDQVTTIGGTNFRSSYNAAEFGPGTGGLGSGQANGGTRPMAAFVVGNNGIILFDGNGIEVGSDWYNETSGTLQNLFSVYCNKSTTSGTYDYTAIVVGGTGTVLKSSRSWGSTSYGWTIHSVLGISGNPILTDLYGVAGDDSIQSTSSKWVAVGEYSVIITSSDNGETWTQRVTPTTTNLNAIRYCNGTWVAVGDGGTILTSTNLTTWTQIAIGLTDRNLYTIDYSPTWNTINIGGQGIILHSSASSITFSSVLSLAPAQSLDLTRLTWYGSNELVANNTVGPVEQQVLNSQVFSGTIVDTAYSAGQETTYYLIIGNMAGSQVKAGQVFLQATEVKR